MVDLHVVDNSDDLIVTTTVCPLTNQSFIVALATTSTIIVTLYGATCIKDLKPEPIITQTISLAGVYSISMSTDTLAILFGNNLVMLDVNILMTQKGGERCKKEMKPI